MQDMNNIINFKSALHERNALLFCEKYGIIEYTVKGNQLVYYRNNAIMQGVYRTYKHIVNLDTMKETVTELKGCYKRGNVNA